MATEVATAHVLVLDMLVVVEVFPDTVVVVVIAVVVALPEIGVWLDGQELVEAVEYVPEAEVE